MIVAMFALVIFSMVVAGVLLTATHRAYSDPEALAGGFDLRADLNDPTTYRTCQPNWPALGDRAADFVGLGRLATRPGQIIEIAPAPSSGARTPTRARCRLRRGLRSPWWPAPPGFESDAAVWAAVLGDAATRWWVAPAVADRGPTAPLRRPSNSVGPP